MNDRLSASRESREDGWKKRLPGTRRLLAALSFGAVVAAIALVLVPAAATKGGSNGLEARVVLTTKGPLPPCDSGAIPCTSANRVDYFIYVNNKNEIQGDPATGSFRARFTLENSFVIEYIDETISVDGVESFGGRYTPPPNVTYNGDPAFLRSRSGHWPSTVTCATGSPDPCTDVGSPAVIPGENTVAFYGGFVHATVALGEPAGTYVFTYTIHGTLNGAPGTPGTPVDVTASSKKIVMT